MRNTCRNGIRSKTRTNSEVISSIAYEKPVLSRTGVNFIPPKVVLPVVDPISPLYTRINSVFDKRHFLYAIPPVELGHSGLEFVDFATIPNILRAPIKFPGTEYRIPKELLPIFHFIERLALYERAINPNHDDAYAHITVETKYVKKGKVQRVGGWHVDGFQGIKNTPKVTAEHNYIVTDSPSTEFCIQPFFLAHLDEAKHNLFLEIEEQASESNAYGTLPCHVYLMDPYMVHRCPKMPVGRWRFFVRVCYAFLELDHPKNTINPMFDGQKYPERVDIRKFLGEFPKPGVIPYEQYGITKL